MNEKLQWFFEKNGKPTLKNSKSSMNKSGLNLKSATQFECMKLNKRTNKCLDPKTCENRNITMMSGSDRNTSGDCDAMLHRHLHVKSFAKMDQSGQAGEQRSQKQQQQQHSHQHQHQEQQHPTCESPIPKIKRKIGNEELTSHRLIEKRRRDRMNSCLADLSRLIPSSYLKKGRGRVEKTEIVQMAIKYIRQLQQQGDNRQPKESIRFDASIQTPPASESPVDSDSKPSPDLFLIGYNECFEEAVQFIVERESLDPTRLVVHLRNHYEEVSVSKVRKLSPSLLKAPRRYGLNSSDSDYSSLQSDTSSSISDWSSCTQSSKATSVSVASQLTTASSASGLSTFNSCQDGDDNNLMSRKEHRSEKRSFKTTEDLGGQYKFKADMRDRFRYHQDSYWQPGPITEPRTTPNSEEEGRNSNSNNSNANKDDWNWPNASAPWPLKRRRQHPVTFCDNRDARAMPPPPPTSEMENIEISENNWTSKQKPTIAAPTFQHQSMSDTTENGCQQRISSNGEGSASHRSFNSNKTQQQLHEALSSNIFYNLKHKSVPIFALHPLGSYYIPMVVNYGLLAPFLTVLEEPRPGIGLTLHPVTISVNFCTKPVIHMPPVPSSTKPTSLSEKPYNVFLSDEEKFSRESMTNTPSTFEPRNRTSHGDHRCNN